MKSLSGAGFRTARTMGTGFWPVCLAIATAMLAACGGSSGGSTPVMPAPSGLSYPTPQMLTVGTAAGSISPTVTGTVDSYTVQPALPAGLSLNGTSGVISGTPTKISSAANYTVTAANATGTTAATLSIAVNDVSPTITYGTGTLAFTQGVAVQPVVPANTAGTAVSWSIAPSLPAGLSFSTSDGSIGGTPTVAAPASDYMVTAMNSGGQSAFKLRIVVEAAPLLELGHADRISVLRSDNTRVLSEDISGHWVLWDSATAAMVAEGESNCSGAGCNGRDQNQVNTAAQIAGPTTVIFAADGLEVRSSADGHLLGSIGTVVSWWKLATDGSYVAGGNTSGLSVWNSAGQTTVSRTGDYSKAKVFAAAGELRIADGPAGQNVIETIALPGGTSTLGAAFQGQFQTWFVDGERFLTNISNTVWTYSKSSVQQDITTVSSVHILGGEGNWFWTDTANGANLNIYAAGSSSSPAATYALPATTDLNSVVASGTTLAILSYGPETVSVIDLSGASPVKSDHTLPIAYTTAYSAQSASHWWVGNLHGVLLDGASLSGTARYFGYGQAWSIAGSATRIAIATASGKILYFDTGTGATEGSIDFPSSKVLLSADGLLLAAAGNETDSQYNNDWSVFLYSLPSGTVVTSWPYAASSPPIPLDISLASSGSALGQVLTNGRQVNALPGAAPIWNDSLASVAQVLDPIRLSPDGTLIAVSDGGLSPGTGTKILKNGVLATAVSGWAVGWLDNAHLLVNEYVFQNHVIGGVYSGCSIYDSTGQKLSSPGLPELRDIQPVSADTVYSSGRNAIYSVTSGAATWTSADASRGVGAVAAGRVVFASGARVLAETY